MVSLDQAIDINPDYTEVFFPLLHLARSDYRFLLETIPPSNHAFLELSTGLIKDFSLASLTRCS
jgi:hypothetical protein